MREKTSRNGQKIPKDFNSSSLVRNRDCFQCILMFFAYSIEEVFLENKKCENVDLNRLSQMACYSFKHLLQAGIRAKSGQSPIRKGWHLTVKYVCGRRRGWCIVILLLLKTIPNLFWVCLTRFPAGLLLFFRNVCQSRVVKNSLDQPRRVLRLSPRVFSKNKASDNTPRIWRLAPIQILMKKFKPFEKKIPEFTIVEKKYQQSSLVLCTELQWRWCAACRKIYVHNLSY